MSLVDQVLFLTNLKKMKSRWNRINSRPCHKNIGRDECRIVPNSERRGGGQQRGQQRGGATISVNTGWEVSRWFYSSLHHLSPGGEGWVWLFELERQSLDG